MDKKLLTTICLTLLYPLFAFGFTHTLVWAPPTNNTPLPNDTYVKGYYLQQSTNSGVVFYPIASTTGYNSTSTVVVVTLTNMQYCYRVNAWNDAGTSTFSNVACTITPWPVIITSNPSDVNAFIGQTASFTISATGREPIVYQWQKDGINIANATNKTYTISAVNASHVGNYKVVVGNPDGAATSLSAALNVYGSPGAPISIRIIVSP
jgi:hypothetical protein